MGRENFTFRLEGKNVTPINWKDFTINSQLKTGTAQPTISTEQMKLVGDDARELARLFRQNAFKGPLLSVEAGQSTDVVEILNAMVDFTTGYKESGYKDLTALDDPSMVEFRIRSVDGVNNFLRKIEVTTYGYLESIGKITEADYQKIGYKIQKKFDGLEFVMLSFALMSTLIEIAKAANRVGNQVGTVAGMVGTSLTGSVGALIYVIFVLVIELVLLAVLILQFYALAVELNRYLYSPRRNDWGMYLRRLLEIGCEHLEYKFISPIIELDQIVLDPSKPQGEVGVLGELKDFLKSPKNGIPNSDDFGYKLSEVFKSCITAFNAEIAIIPDTKEVHLRTVDDPWWLSQSEYVLRDNLQSVDVAEFNLSDVVADNSLSYDYDLKDEWTIDEFEGTNYQVVTAHQQEFDRSRDLLGGFKKGQIPYARGIRKAGLSPLEISLATVFSAIDGLINAFGGNSNLAAGVKSGVNLMKKSDFYHSKPKWVHWDKDLDGIPENYIALTGAKALFEKYHKYDSFVDNGTGNKFGRQRVIHNKVRVPFNLSEFKKLLTNPYFVFMGNRARATEVNWKWGEGEADLTFWREFTYWTNGKETKFEG